MPNPAKSLACCGPAAQYSITATYSRGLSRKWKLKSGPTSKTPEVHSYSQQRVPTVIKHQNGLLTRPRFVTETSYPSGCARKQLLHTHLSTDLESNSIPQSSNKLIKFVHEEDLRDSLRLSSRPLNHSKTKTRARWKVRILDRFKKQITSKGSSYTSSASVPKRVKAAIHRAQQALQLQGRTISKEAFAVDIRIRASSLFPYQGIPTWWVIHFQDLFKSTAEGKLEAWQMPRKVDDFTCHLISILEGDGFQSFKVLWDGLERNVKTAQWPLLAFWLLRNAPSKILDFLLATNSEPYPPFGMISDCMLYLRYFHKKEIGDRFRSVLLECMDPERWPVVVLPQRGVRFYLTFAGLENAYRAFELLRSRESQISATTLLAFMNVFTKASDVDKALDCLRMIAATDSKGISIDSEEVLRHCCKLVQLDEVVEEDGARNFKILPQILELGVRPGLEMMNIVLSNAFATGDPHLGYDMLKYMKDQGMKPSSYTYLELLKDAVARADRSRLDALLQEINTNEELRNNKFIASKVFHAHFIFGTKNAGISDDSAKIFSDMLNLYCRYYDPTPLRELGIIPEHYNTVDVERDTEPSSPVLFIMLASYLRCNPSQSRTMRVYNRFRALISKRHPTIAPLVQYPQIFNEFILPFRNYGEDLKDCVSIVEDMLEPKLESFTISDSVITPARPNLWTWTTLMSVYVAHGDPHGVETVRDIMNKHGIHYNIVTWNTIINGTVRNQDVPATAAAMKEMDAQGFMPDSYTLKALRLARDPELLQAAIKKLDREAEELLKSEQIALEQEHELLLEKGLKRLVFVDKS